MPHFHLLPSSAAMSCVCCPRTSQASDYLVHLASHHSLPPSLPPFPPPPFLFSPPLLSSLPAHPIPYPHSISLSSSSLPSPPLTATLQGVPGLPGSLPTVPVTSTQPCQEPHHHHHSQHNAEHAPAHPAWGGADSQWAGHRGEFVFTKLWKVQEQCS